MFVDRLSTNRHDCAVRQQINCASSARLLQPLQRLEVRLQRCDEGLVRGDGEGLLDGCGIAVLAPVVDSHPGWVALVERQLAQLSQMVIRLLRDDEGADGGGEGERARKRGQWAGRQPRLGVARSALATKRSSSGRTTVAGMPSSCTGLTTSMRCAVMTMVHGWVISSKMLGGASQTVSKIRVKI